MISSLLKSNNMIKILIVLVIISMVAMSVSNRTSVDVDKSGRADLAAITALVQTGDLVVRNHDEFSSQLIRKFNRSDKSFSHAGVVVVEDGYPFVYHMVRDDRASDHMQRDSIDVFCSPKSNFSFGVYRYLLASGEKKLLVSTLYEWFNTVRFDMQMDLYDYDKMYCSEMVAKLIERSTSHRIRIGHTTATASEVALYCSFTNQKIPTTANFEVIAIDNLYLNNDCELIKRVNYRHQ